MVHKKYSTGDGEMFPNNIFIEEVRESGDDGAGEALHFVTLVLGSSFRKFLLTENFNLTIGGNSDNHIQIRHNDKLDPYDHASVTLQLGRVSVTVKRDAWSAMAGNMKICPAGTKLVFDRHMDTVYLGDPVNGVILKHCVLDSVLDSNQSIGGSIYKQDDNNNSGDGSSNGCEVVRMLSPPQTSSSAINVASNKRKSGHTDESAHGFGNNADIDFVIPLKRNRLSEEYDNEDSAKEEEDNEPEDLGDPAAAAAEESEFLQLSYEEYRRIGNAMPVDGYTNIDSDLTKVKPDDNNCRSCAD